jgi:hypothetical protein
MLVPIWVLLSGDPVRGPDPAADPTFFREEQDERICPANPGSRTSSTVSTLTKRIVQRVQVPWSPLWCGHVTPLCCRDVEAKPTDASPGCTPCQPRARNDLPDARAPQIFPSSLEDIARVRGSPPLDDALLMLPDASSACLLTLESGLCLECAPRLSRLADLPVSSTNFRAWFGEESKILERRQFNSHEDGKVKRWQNLGL